MRNLLENILSYRLKLRTHTKEEVLEGVLFTVLNYLNVEPVIAKACFNRVLFNLKERSKNDRSTKQ